MERQVRQLAAHPEAVLQRERRLARLARALARAPVLGRLRGARVAPRALAGRGSRGTACGRRRATAALTHLVLEPRLVAPAKRQELHRIGLDHLGEVDVRRDRAGAHLGVLATRAVARHVAQIEREEVVAGVLEDLRQPLRHAPADEVGRERRLGRDRLDHRDPGGTIDRVHAHFHAVRLARVAGDLGRQQARSDLQVLHGLARQHLATAHLLSQLRQIEDRRQPARLDPAVIVRRAAHDGRDPVGLRDGELSHRIGALVFQADSSASCSTTPRPSGASSSTASWPSAMSDLSASSSSSESHVSPSPTTLSASMRLSSRS